ncbi:unnamed protein product [Rotaria sp. Silwood2]|nr:unnamed protein product [Rotaria sp. Silwood2]CAF3303575.1 unnamed protein product [Rotaria sp. Silwood2]CAF4020860.1 unnamed protein product [Rotaria sp. Silwood2]CAF4052758.1 unnamed protein product [Rotaria sp. Silwood2]
MSLWKRKEVYVFFGVSGAGKSSTINTLCDATICKVGDDESSETRGCKLVQVNRPKTLFHGKYLLDMQGFNDTRPECTREVLFKLMALYFLANQITFVQCFIFVVNMQETKTDFFESMAQYLGALFNIDNVKRNIVLLLTHGDALKPEIKGQKLDKIKQTVSNLILKCNWRVELIEWSNEKPLYNQEYQLSIAVSKLSGFDAKYAIVKEEREVDRIVDEKYNSTANVERIYHEKKCHYEIKDEWSVVEELIEVRDDIRETTYIPEKLGTKIVKEEETLYFSGHVIPDGGDAVDQAVDHWTVGLARLALFSIIGNLAVNSKWERTETKTAWFNGEVTYVTWTPLESSSLLKRLHIDDITGSYVRLNADLECYPGNLVMSWNFGVKLVADVKQSYVIQRARQETKVIPRTRLERVKRDVCRQVPHVTVLAPPRWETIYRWTKAQIRQEVITQRIFGLI